MTTRRSVVRTGITVAVSLAATVALALAPVLGAAATPGAAPARAAAAGTPLSLAVLVPLTVRPTSTGLLDSATLTADTAPLGVLSRQLDAVYDTPAVIGIDPMIIASIQVLGSSAPASAIAWLERLRSASNETFALAYADADLASLAQANALDLANPLGFDFAIDPSHFGPASTPSATPAPTASASSAAVPTPSPTAATGPRPLPVSAADVLAWSYTLSNIAWPAEDTVATGDLAPLSVAGYRDVVLSSSNVSGSSSGSVDLDKMRGIVSDAGISSLVRQATSATNPAVAQEAVGRLNSALSGMEAVSPGRTVVATLDRQWSSTGTNLDVLFADLAAQASVLQVGLSAVLAGAHPDAKVVDEAEDSSRNNAVRSLLNANAAETEFASAAVNPTLVLEPRQLQLLSVLAVSWVHGGSDWGSTVSAFLTASSTLRAAVHIVTGSNLFVGAGRTNIPVTVSNALTVPVTVYVTVSSPSSILQVQKQGIALTVEPGSSNKAAIPVQALTNGTVTTTVTISSKTGFLLGSADSVEVDLQPGWESVGTTVIVVLLVLVFGGGIARNILKRRRKQHETVGAPAEVDGE
ncbi:MAG: hypothetical protein HIU88_05870 [Acidobacteria bacterium]|nr:hypothetical protein [Acidobacteriota bacterium]